MEDTAGLQDWELLQNSDTALISVDNPKVSEGIDDDSEDGAIKYDYFALDSEKRHRRRVPSEEESEEGGIDSDNPSWLDPDSDSRYIERPGGEVGFAATRFPPRNNSGGFWSDDSSDSQRSLADSEKGEPGNMWDSITEVGFEGLVTGHLNSGRNAAGKDLGLDEFGGSEAVETGPEKHDELHHGELVKIRDGSDSSAQMSTGIDSPNSISTGGEGEKRGMVWWKMPFEFLKFCALRVRPIWSISIAAAFIGVFMLGKRLYKMKNKSRSIPLKIFIDDKTASQFMVRAAFSGVRRAPLVRSSSLRAAAGGVTPWPVVSMR